MNFMTRFVFILNSIVVFCTIGSYLSPLIDPARISLFSIFGLGYPILLFINLFFVLLWVFVDIKYSLLSILTLLIGYGHFNEFIALNSPAESLVSTFSVVSYNIGNARSAYDVNKQKQKEKAAKIANFLFRFKDEDIICLQEVGAFASDILANNLNHPFVHRTNKGVIIFSKHPIVNKGHIEFGTITNSCLWADLVVGLDTLRVYNMHFQSNAITNDANELLDKPDLNNENTWIGIKGIMNKYLRSHVKRTQQASMVKKHLQDCKYPAIVCGDFNDTPLTYTYEFMKEGLIDNFVQAGNGIGTTFNGRIPLLRIDYILTDSSFMVHNFNIIKEDFSDHYPIASQLSRN